MTTSLENIKNKIDIQEAMLKNKLEDNSNALNEKNNTCYKISRNNRR